MKPTAYCLLLLAGCSLALSQAPAGGGEPAYMDKPPAIGPVKAYAPPTFQSDQLPNGLKIVTVEDHRFPLVTIDLALRAGTSRLTLDQAGLASAEADLLTEGTPTRTSLQIAQTADSLGGSIGASADSDFLTVSANGLSNRVPELFQLFSDVVLHASFPENEVAIEKANMLQALRASRADPGFLATVEFNKVLFGTNPYAITSPTEASIAAINRRALVKFHDDYFLPNNQAEIVIVGDINAARAHNLAQQYFGDWKLGRPAPPPSPAPPVQKQRRIYLIERPGSAQSTILVGNLGLTRTAPDYYPFLVANEILGGSFNSRLIADIREQKGYTYDISSENDPRRELGSWQVSTEVRTQVTAPTLQEILAQLDKMRTAPPSGQEMIQAKNFLGGNFVLGLQTQEAVAGEVLATGIYALPPDRLATWVSNVEQVTADDAEAAAQEVIHPDQAIVVVVGDVKQIAPQLAPLAPGTVMPIYNEQGQQVGQYPPAAGAGPSGQ